ncbi:adenosine deaminase [Rothia sp. P13129]|uniref:adenosine deaminase n=1 Tax=unclassified Rothia (in: high G+C Gram-positive bacteria) TaxID=2689056 RepID=UPI003AD4622E
MTQHDEQWIQKLPKVCLHDHLDGGLQPQTMIDIAQDIGYELPSTERETLQQWFFDAANSGSLDRYLETFTHTLALMQRAEDLQRIAQEHVLACAADGVIYAEVRWAPEQHQRAGLSLDEAVRAVATGLNDGMEMVAQAGGRVLVNQILCAMRDRNNSRQIAELAVKYRTLGVVGFDLAGAEENHPVEQHREALDYLAENFMPVTIHAGEAEGLRSIRSALLVGRALRIGHGVRITEDFSYTTVGEIDPEGKMMPQSPKDQKILQLGALASWVKDRRITLEVCPCSNIQTRAAYAVEHGVVDSARIAENLSEHPVNALREAGFAVTISPDNRLMSGSSVTAEFVHLANIFGYQVQDFFELTTNAIEGAFISMEEKQHLMRAVQGAYMSVFEEQNRVAQEQE